MAVEAVGGNSAVSAATVTATGCTVTAGNRVILIATYGNGGKANPSTVTWNGASANLVVGSDVHDGTWTGCAIYEIVSPTPGTGNAVANWGSSHSQIAVHFASVTGATGVAVPSTNTGTTANPSVTAANSVTGDLVIAACCNDNETGTMVPAGTQIFNADDVGSDTDHNSQYQTASGSGHVMSWTKAASSQHWSAVAYPINGAGGAVGATVLPVFAQHVNTSLRL